MGSNMKVFTAVAAMVAMASAEPQLLVAQKNVDYFRQPNVGEMVSNVNVDYVDLRNGVGQGRMRNTYVLLPSSTANLGQPLTFGNTFYPYSLSTPIKMINKREADPDQVGETTHAKVYKSKVSNGDGAYYEYEVQVNRDGEGQSFQHHQQVQQKQQPKRLEEQLYHSMISNLYQVNINNNLNQALMDQVNLQNNRRNQQFNQQQRYIQQLNNQASQQQGEMLIQQLFANQNNNQRQNQINQINEQRNQINNQQRNQINQQRNRFYQLERPQYSHRLINQFNNQQRQQYIREKLNNFGRAQQRIKREAEPSMEYSVAASHPAQPEQMTRYTQNIRNNMNHPEMSPVNNLYRNIYNLPVMKVQPMVVPMVRKMTTRPVMMTHQVQPQMVRYTNLPSTVYTTGISYHH